jgi:magnesium transporter
MPSRLCRHAIVSGKRAVANVAIDKLDDLALHHVSQAFAELRGDETVAQALASIRSQRLDSAILYFYVVDDDRRLHGVVPTRRLLMSDPRVLIASIMSDASITLPETASLREGAAMLVHHRLLAVPVVGRFGRMHGVLDATALGIDIAAEMNGRRVDQLFQLIGVHVTDTASHAFRARFPSLLWNVGGGLIAALIASAHEHLLSTLTALALFMPVTLALGESVGMQSVALAIDGGLTPPARADWRSALRAITQEARTTLGLGLACAGVVGFVAAMWQRDFHLTMALLLSITAAMTVSGVVGTITPRVLHRIGRNPSVAAGPTVLALADFLTLVVYFRVATVLLQVP